MYFINRNNTNIDDEFDEKKKFPIQNKKLLIIIGIILVIFIIGFIFIKNKKSDVNYFLSLEGESLITIYKDSEFIDPGYIAKDNLGNILTKDVQIEGYVDADKIGDYKLIYKFHNQEKTRYISVVEKPIGATLIYLLGDLTVYLDINEEYKEPGYIVIDSVDSTLTDKVVVNNNLDITKKGTYYIVYSVTNSAGVTTQAKRTVIVADSDISLSISNDKYTNKDVEIKINISDNYFDYLLLPDGNKVNNKNYTYKVSSNGVYKFISYNKKGTKKESSIKIDNIDKEKPTGSCSGSYSNGKSLININASDNIGISRYVIDGNSYTSKSITLNKEVSKVSIIIYDKAGNMNTISCNLSNNNSQKPDPGPTPVKGLEIHFIASGAYDDAILIKTNDKVILIDSGRWACRNYVTPYLQKLGIKKIDVMIGSHLHNDHIAAQADILDNFQVGDIYYPDDIFTCVKRGSCEEADQYNIVNALKNHGKNPVVITAPKRIDVGDMQLYFLAPHTIVSGKYSQNANSFIFILKYYNNSFMFTGDSGNANMNVSKLIEKANSLGVSLDIDVLKYPHHGNGTINDNFLSTIKAEYVIVPNYKAPKFPNDSNKNIINRYGIKMYRQSDSSTGNILITSDGSNINIINNYS